MPHTDPPPTLNIMRHLGLAPDPWQADVLASTHGRILLNCCRQAGKSTTVAVLALVEALFKPMTKVLIVSRSHRQAKELLKQISFYHRVLGDRLLAHRSVAELELTNLSRIVSVPCKEETIRGFSHVNLMILDEASRIPDDLYRAVRPMLAISKGRLLCLSTPHGKRGFFYDAWAHGGDDWLRVEIPASKCPRIAPEFLEQERRALGPSWFRQEYECSFEALEGLVYPDFQRCVVDALPAHVPPDPAAKGRWDDTRWVGGMDFGFRNPFAAVWGVVDRDEVLWLLGEHYQSQKPLSHHVRFLPKEVKWHADPSGAAEICELRRAGFVMCRGTNTIRLGISTILARVEAGLLKVLKGRCPHLLTEAGLYRYGEGPDRENPLAMHNHALDALRYLVSRLNNRCLTAEASSETPPTERRKPSYQEMVDDDRYWSSH